MIGQEGTQQPALVDQADHVHVEPDRRPRTLNVWWSLLFVLGVFVAMQVPVAIGFELATPSDPAHASFWDGQAWGKYDSWLYIDIAKGGYSLQRCDPGPGQTAEDWCGNAAWSPAYPAFIRLGQDLGFERATAAYLWTRIFTLGLLALLFFGYFGRRLTASTVGAMLLASVWPGAVYFLGLHPMSLVLLALLGSAYLLARDRPLLGGLAGAVVVAGHSSGIYLIGFVGLWLLLEHRHQLRRAVRAGALFALPTVGAYLGWLALLQAQTGRWNATFLIQQKYHLRLLFAPSYLFTRISVLWDNPEQAAVAPAVQSLFVAVLVLTAAVVALTRWRSLAPIERLVVIIAVGFWLAPLTVGGDAVGYHRLELLTLPAVVVLRRLPAPVLGALAAIAAVVTVFMTRLYVQAQLF
jgi:hypothetical protein